MNHEELRIATQKELQRGTDMISKGAEIVRRASDNLARLRCLDAVVSEQPATPKPKNRTTEQRLEDLVGGYTLAWVDADSSHIGFPDDGIMRATARVSHPKKPTTQVKLAYELPRARGYNVGFRLELSSNFKFGGEKETGKLAFGFAGGSRPSGGTRKDDGTTCRLGWDKRKLAAYYYGFDHKGKWGKHYISDLQLEPGRAYNISFSCVVEEPGKKNGWIYIEADNKEVLLTEGLQTMNKNAYLDQMWFNFFAGGDDMKHRPPHDLSVLVSQVNVTKLFD